jgi:hypothetical protein
MKAHLTLSLFVFIIALQSVSSAASPVSSDQETCVQFDAPRKVAACDVTPPEIMIGVQPMPESSAPVPGSGAVAFVGVGPAADQRLVQLAIPLTAQVTCPDKMPVMQVRFEIRMIGQDAQVVDYSPRTHLYSEFDGPVSVESSQEQKGSLGLNIESDVLPGVRIGGNAGSSVSGTQTESYQRIPEQQVLLASGTIDRGQGVFFKFNQSPQTTLEGDHTVMVTLAVPLSWRGGLIRIDCTAMAQSTSIFGQIEQREAGRSSFVVATWAKGDLEALAVVDSYIASETNLRNAVRSIPPANKRSPNSLASWIGNQPASPLPARWASEFMLYESRSIVSGIRPHLDRKLQAKADEFLACRNNLLQLGRPAR